MKRSFRCGRWAAAALTVVVCPAAEPPKDQFLQWMNAIAQRQLDRRDAEIASVHTVADADRRREYVRAKALEMIGGLPEYSGPLNARVTGTVPQDGYVIEKLYFESLPGIWVTANLYRPAAAGRHPAVLFPIGHWDEGKAAAQTLAGNLALKGFVVLAYDPLGQGERLQAFDARLNASVIGSATAQHTLEGAQAALIGQSFARYRIWDAKRALDYLVSRPEVDTERIGCTGCSGGGTLTTYISALDKRIKVAAPACYMTSMRLQFAGSLGDSEQSLQNFLANGLDLTDWVELAAPKPWLVVSTLEDFFPIEGARQLVAESKRWYGIYGAEDRVGWAVGHGGHGTPVEQREAITAWFIRWLKDGRGDKTEQHIRMLPPKDLQATETGQVQTQFPKGRDLVDVMREDLKAHSAAGTRDGLMAQLAAWSPEPPPEAPHTRVIEETRTESMVTQRLLIESEPGLELAATLWTPRGVAKKAGVLVVDTMATPKGLAEEIARAGAVVLSLEPRGEPARVQKALLGDCDASMRAMMIGKNLAGLHAFDIRRGISVLASQPGVDPTRIRAAAYRTSGVWLLIAAALDQRINGIWIDRTPWSLRAAFDSPVTTDLYAAALPGFVLKWDLDDIVKAIHPRPVLWTDPTDWLNRIADKGGEYRYRAFEEGNGEFVRKLVGQ